MARYVDGYVLPVPEHKLAEYKKMAAMAGKMWMKYGALQYVEAVGDDLNPKFASMQFPKIAKAKEGETVIFAFVVYKSRKHRDQVNTKVMKDPSMNDPKYKDMPMPFDMKRMGYGGFTTLVDL